MRHLLTWLCIVGLAGAIGCGKGYEGRKSPPAGTSDPAAIVQEVKTARGAAPASTEKPESAAKEQATAKEKVEEASAAPPPADSGKPDETPKEK